MTELQGSLTRHYSQHDWWVLKFVSSDWNLFIIIYVTSLLKPAWSKMNKRIHTLCICIYYTLLWYQSNLYRRVNKLWYCMLLFLMDFPLGALKTVSFELIVVSTFNQNTYVNTFYKYLKIWKMLIPVLIVKSYEKK